MKYVVLLIALVVAHGSLVAAESVESAGNSPSASLKQDTNRIDAAAIEIRNLKKANFSGLRAPLRTVISDHETWAEVWSKHSAGVTPSPALPAVDFSREVVLVAALGQKKTGGYAIEIVSVRPKGKKLEVLVHERTPADNAMTIQSLTAPVHFVAIPSEAGQVPRFIWTIKKDRLRPSLELKRKAR